MPKWITTNWYSVSYGWQHESKGGWVARHTERFYTPEDELRTSLNELTAYLDKNQYTIKAIIPKTQGFGCHDYSSRSDSSYGWGYGVTPITGFVVLAQQEREVSQEEYTRLSRVQALKNALPSLREKFQKLQQAVDADEKKDTNISEKKKLLGGLRYCIGEHEFSSEAEAKAVQAELLAQAAANRQALDEAKAKLEAASRELEELG